MRDRNFIVRVVISIILLVGPFELKADPPFGCEGGPPPGDRCQELMCARDPLACSECSYTAGAPIGTTCESAPWSLLACTTIPKNAGNFTFLTPPNLDPLIAFGPGDFPPLFAAPEKSSTALLSSESSHTTRLGVVPERPALNKVVDLISGMPLIQETDFELPFGGATFRRVRTYSNNIAHHKPWAAGSGTVADYIENWSMLTDLGSFYDWNGLFWMSSENPILLFDANPNWNVDRVRRTYLVLDAHHALPFEPQPSSGGWRYVAPAWFDATMSFSADGVLDASGNWTSFPSEVYIWLNKNSVKYTFRVNYRLIPPRQHEPDPSPSIREFHNSSFIGCLGDDYCEDADLRDYPISDRDISPTFGSPHLGFVSKIEDRYGNQAVYHYNDARQFSCEESSYSRDIGLFPPQYCTQCCNECNQLGEVKAIELKTASGTTAWTMLFTYREFGSLERSAWRNGETLRFPHAIHSIHVYDGAHAIPTQDLLLPWQSFCSAPSLAALDALNHGAITNDWKIEAKFLYAPYMSGQETSSYGYEDYYWSFPKALGSEQNCPSAALFGGAADFQLKNGQLLRSKVTRRVSGAEGQSLSSSYQFYRYEDHQVYGWYMLQHQENRTGLLKKVYDNEVIQSLLQSNPGVSVDQLFIRADSDVVRVINPRDQSVEQKPFGTLASLDFTARAPDPEALFGHYDAHEYYSVQGSGDDLKRSLTAQAGLNDLTTYSIGAGQVASFVDRRTSSPDPGEFKLYLFRSYPAGQSPEDPQSNTYASLFHYPYMITTFDSCNHSSQWGCDSQNGEPVMQSARPPWDQPLYIMVTDQIQPGETYEPITKRGVKIRRIVEINPAGFVLRDRSWNYAAGAGQDPTEQLGVLDFKKTDCKGRVLERRSLAWAVADAAGAGDTEGLIEVFSYLDNACGGADPDRCSCDGIPVLGEASEPIAYGVKRGKGGATQWKFRVDRHPDRQDLITRRTEFLTPTTDLYASSPNVTEYEFELEGTQHKIMNVSVVHPPAPRQQGGPGFYPLEKESYNDDGLLIWQGHGSVRSPAAINPAQDYFFLNYNAYEGGQPRYLVEDYDPQSFSMTHCGEGLPGDAPQPPPGFVRADGTGLGGLNLVTLYENDPLSGPVRTVYPNCLEDRVIVTQPSPDEMQVITLSSLTNLGTGQFRAGAPGSVSSMRLGRIERTDTVRFVGDHEPNQEWPREIISTSILGYDDHGKLSSMQVQAQGGSSYGRAGVVFYPTGELARKVEPDGTIHRYRFDSLGRRTHTYRGTRDQHVFWGTAEPSDDPCSEGEHNVDNMNLLERITYGDESLNAGLPVIERRYREQPHNRYSFDPPSDCTDRPPPNDEDRIGSVTRVTYDWRRRPVLKTTFGGSGEFLEAEAVLYDYEDRERFRIALPSASVDPTLIRNLSENVTAAGGSYNPGPILEALSPLSLTEQRYDLRGAVSEMRRYDVTDRTGLRFTKTASFFDDAQQVVERWQPDQGVERAVYDSRGREIRRSMFAGPRELSREERSYDLNNRPYRITVYDRLPGSTDSSPLTAHNSVRSYTYEWWDRLGRKVAEANFGTNSATNSYSPANPPSLPDDPDELAALSPARLNEHDEVVGCTTDAFGPNVRVQCTAYDSAGRAVRNYLPDGSWNSVEYNSIGRKILEIENAGATQASERRVTAYWYEPVTSYLGKIAAVLPKYQDGGVSQYDQIDWGRADGVLQITQIKYGATVVDRGGQAIGEHPAWIRVVSYPDPITGQPSDKDILTFSYYGDGKVASRYDGRGVGVRYSYDDVGRRTSIEYDDKKLYPIEHPLPNLPVRRGSKLLFSYTPVGQLATAVSLAATGDSIAKNEFTYDGFGNLTSDSQALFGALRNGNGTVKYQWALGGGEENYLRLTNLSYPQPGLDGRARQIDFGFDGGAGDGRYVSRVASLSDSRLRDLARYSYSGLGLRTSQLIGGALVQDFEDGGAVFGLTGFAEVQNLHFKRRTGGATVYRSEYGYDTRGNQIFNQITTQRPNGLPRANDRSYRYEFDSLNQLARAERGHLLAQGSTRVLDQAQPFWTTAWNLDNLGNWSGGDSRRGSVVHEASRAAPLMPRSVHQQVALNNQIQEIFDDSAGRITLRNDRAGNLVFDGSRVYQYDALSRLIRVCLPGSVVLSEEGAIASGVLGPVIAEFNYDALGRLIYRGDSNTGSLYFYDGVRRIQERTVRWSANRADTAREYVYSPHDIDEVIAIEEPALAQAVEADTPGVLDKVFFAIEALRRGNKASLVVQDQDKNVVALTDQSGKVQKQYSYSPYGLLLESEEFSPGVVNRIGHQGLFWESLGFESEFKINSATRRLDSGLYYNRNRFFSPQLGRFIQRDPNATAAPVMQALAMNGEGLDTQTNSFDLGAHYRDGLNPYLYQKANPFGRDPLGLYDPFDQMDEIVSEMYGERAAFLAAITSAVGQAVDVAKTVATFAVSFLPGGDAILLLAKLASGEPIELEDILSAGLSLVGGAIVGKLIGHTLKLAGKYAAKGARLSKGIAKGLKIAESCLTSFAAGTMVLMADGTLKPIEQVVYGDQVMCDYNPEAADGPETCTVTNTFTRLAPEIVNLEVESDGRASELLVTSNHELFDQSGKARPVALLPNGTQLLCHAEQGCLVSERSLVSEATQVFNLEVSPAHNYFVGEDHVLVHNSACSIRMRAFLKRVCAGFEKVASKSEVILNAVGNADEAFDEFADLVKGLTVSSQDISNGNRIGFVAHLEDGSTVTYRSHSKYGPPTVEINRPGAKNIKCKFK